MSLSRTQLILAILATIAMAIFFIFNAEHSKKNIEEHPLPEKTSYASHQKKIKLNVELRSNTPNEQHRQTENIPKTNHQLEQKFLPVKENTPWMIYEPSEKTDNITRDAIDVLKIPDSSPEPALLLFNKSFFDEISQHTIVPLPLPSLENEYEMYVNDIADTKTGKTIHGHIQGHDIGYGITMTYGEDWIYAQIITPKGQFNIETVKGVTLILEDMTTFDSYGMESDTPTSHKKH